VSRRSGPLSPRAGVAAPTPTEVNARLWQRDHVARYAGRVLRPVEVILLARYSEALSGRVLELGCGGGRVLGYLVALGGEVHGIDVSAAMVDHCRRTYPSAHVHLGDLTAARRTVQGPFGAVFAPDSVLDVVEPDQRRQVLEDIRALLAPDGLLLFSSHNLAHADGATEPGGRAARALRLARRAAHVDAFGVVSGAGRVVRGLYNRRQLAPLQRRADDHAILNDSEGDYGVLHYYVRRDDQERQLRECGFTLLECLEADGNAVPPGTDGVSPWLHYVARPA
jgi:SAM-dependent methyltransferase